MNGSEITKRSSLFDDYAHEEDGVEHAAPSLIAKVLELLVSQATRL